MKKIIFLILFFVMITEAFTQDLKPQTFFLGADIRLEGIARKLGERWDSDENEENFSALADSTKDHDLKFSEGESVTVYFGIMPFNNFTFAMDTIYVGDYAQRYHMPTTLEHYMVTEDERFRVIKIESKYETEYVRLAYNYGVPHYSWYYEGDLFDFFPKQLEAERYLRVEGDPSPQWAELSYGQRDFRFTAVVAPELSWGEPPSGLIRYNFNEGARQWTFLYKEEAIDWGDMNNKTEWEENRNDWYILKEKYWLWQHAEHYRHWAVSLRTPLLGIFSLYSGFVYRPNRIGWYYTYVEETDSDQGYLNSKYIIREGETRQVDALGGKLELETEYTPFFDRVAVKGTYLGLLAGNSREVNLDLYKQLQKFLHCDLLLTYKNPLIGPLPFLYEGTKEQPTAIVTMPRGPEAPFWVGPFNRESYLLSVILLFDMTRTPFYLHEPLQLGLWNLNPKEYGPVFAVRYDLKYFPTATDYHHFIAKNEGTGEVEVMWDTGSYGLWATKRPIHSITFLGVMTFVPYIKTILMLEVSESYAETGWAYNEEGETSEWPEPSLKSVTNPYKIHLEVQKYIYSIGGEYGHNVWAPEEWDRQFGYTIDNYYHAFIGLDIQHNPAYTSIVRLEYYGYRESDDEYLFYPSFDEFRCSYTLRTAKFLFLY